MTYPDTDVHAELTHWVERKVDITEHRAVAELLRVTAVPIAIALDTDGRVLRRVSNFVEPEPFLNALKQARASR